MTSPLSPELLDYTRQALERVSRTFALGISKLRDPLRDEIGVAYLICRVLDTIEDTTDIPAQARIDLLKRSHAELLTQSQTLTCAEAIKTFFKEFPGISGDDVELCRNAGLVMQAWLALDSRARLAMQPPILEMAAGMAQTVEREMQGEGLQLRSAEDLDRYCYYVAGTVGKLLTRLFALRLDGLRGDALTGLESRAVDFGLGLQITNVIKGITGDFQRGIVYFPEDMLRGLGLDLDQLFGDPSSPQAQAAIAMMARHTLKYLDSALDYTLAIPADAPDVREFCALPLLFALRTLEYALRTPAALNASEELKITRAEVYALTEAVESAKASDVVLRELFAQERARVDAQLAASM